MSSSLVKVMGPLVSAAVEPQVLASLVEVGSLALVVVLQLAFVVVEQVEDVCIPQDKYPNLAFPLVLEFYTRDEACVERAEQEDFLPDALVLLAAVAPLVESVVSVEDNHKQDLAAVVVIETEAPVVAVVYLDLHSAY